MSEFLSDLPPRPIRLDRVDLGEPIGLWLGPGAAGLEIIAVAGSRRPAVTDLRGAWKARQGGRTAPVLLVVLRGQKVEVCGPAGGEAPRQ